MKPGEYFLQDYPIPLNHGRSTRKIKVVNRGDRQLWVGSHYHFYEVNPELDFNRELAKGMHLNIMPGEMESFPAGEEKEVELVEIGGRKEAWGFRGYTNGPVGKIDTGQVSDKNVSHKEFTKRFGPTTGDKVRLADTNLIVEVEKDFTSVSYGDELEYGWLKTIRNGMGMSSRASEKEALDLVITSVVLIDYWGIVKTDVGVKDGKIHGIGKAGNPDYMDGVSPNMIVGATTDVIDGRNKILTAGGIDPHLHEVCPQLVETAIQSGITTMLGGGTGPSTGTIGTNISPGSWNMQRMLEAAEQFPMNLGFWARGNAVAPEPLIEQLKGGAAGFKLHEDWATTPAVIDNCLNVADQHDVQVCIHTDTSNESGTVETTTVAAINNRAIHSYHTEGAGGGHIPDIMSVAKESSVLPSSTNPTRPFTINTADSNLPMIFQVHGLIRTVQMDVKMAQARIRPETMAAEGILHDMGVLSMMSSDSQAMGHAGEVIIRTWQTAHLMKELRGRLKEEKGDNDNFRVKRYIAKYTINPAITQGISEVVGSVEEGKMADLVLWEPGFFGVKPWRIIKGGFIASAPIGDPNGSTATSEPVMYRPMWGSFGKAPHSTSYTFLSKAAVENGVPKKLGLQKKIYAVRNTRNIGKKDMIHNNATPDITIDPDTFQVYVDGKRLENPPATKVPLSQLYFIW
ncbi:urease subunit alpha [Scopulibacillus darangshiensis]|uniref:urease subunit alpha n=1 Tax=Scopulibacillus darangshiensis TaxID=442528 RepID=UPI001046BE36|nr:urease subunit alpha [Scopulibacillus darangshiensis]